MNTSACYKIEPADAQQSKMALSLVADINVSPGLGSGGWIIQQQRQIIVQFTKMGDSKIVRYIHQGLSSSA